MANKTIKDNRKSSLIQWLVFLSRLIVGGTFVFSGFVKAIDPYGTVYKFQDYFSAFHLDFLSSFAMLFSVALSVIEFVLGVHLLFGSYRKSTPRLIFIFLCVMTPVTLYLAIANPISDCGCFGDAVHLSNWATFLKNVLLLIIVLFLVYRNTSLRALYNQQVQWLTGLYSLLFVFFFVYIGTYYQPYLDFRPYKIGVNIPEALAVEEPEREFVFIYEKNGERKEFLLDNLPSEEEGWVFVDRYEKTVSGQESVTPIIEDFTIYRGATDITEDIIYDENYRILLLSPDLETADDSEVDRINELYDYCVERGYEFACVTASTPQGVEAWQENTGAEYPFYFMDKTVIRTIARGNPCVLLLKGGTILRKTSPSQLPDETLLVQPLDKLTYGQPEIYRLERRIWFIVLLYAVPMLFLLLTEKTVAMIIGRIRQWRDAHRRKKKENENNIIEGKCIVLTNKNLFVMRKNIVAGNWKMNTTLQEGVALAKEIDAALAGVSTKCDVIIATPFTHLVSVVNAIDTKRIGVGAENCADKTEGAYTGEVSAKMVASTGAQYVILGHSERRAYYHETPEILKEKVLLALANGLTPIFCIGEVLEEREAGKHFDVVKAQVEESLFNLSAEDFGKIILAYEPVWAIGTGKTATADQAQEIHAFIRKTIADKYGKEVAENTSILYGGSCKPSNAAELFAKPDVDGGLIGGAALKADSFMGIITAF